MFGKRHDLEVKALPSVPLRHLLQQRLLVVRFSHGRGVTPEHFGFATVELCNDAPIMGERCGGGADCLDVAVGHRRSQVALFLRHGRAIAQQRSTGERTIRFTHAGQADPVRPRSLGERWPPPAHLQDMPRTSR